MSRHWCNQVIDPATCCPVAHGAPEEMCSCPNFYRIANSLPGATLEGYAREIIKYSKRTGLSQNWTWERVFRRWDAYQIGQMWRQSTPPFCNWGFK